MRAVRHGRHDNNVLRRSARVLTCGHLLVVEALLAGAPPLTCGPPGQAPASPLGLIFGERYWTPPPHAGAALPSMAPRTDEAAKQPRARRARAPRKTGAERKFKRRRTGQQDAVSSDYVATDALGRYGSSSCRMPCAPGVGPGLSLPTVFYKLRGGIYRCAHRPDKDRIVRFCRSCRGMELNWEQVQERAANVRGALPGCTQRAAHLASRHVWREP